MITIIDAKIELENLTMLRGRTPTMTDEQRKGAFARLAPYRDGGIFAAKFAGEAAWERHPQGDEIVQIIDGTTTLHLITDDGPQAVALSAGMIAIVPRGMWHRFQSPEGVTLMTATPQPTEHLTVDVEDPRTIA
jgi:mannose-6-phosphate isomerase-like protein (cupin superfamily)